VRVLACLTCPAGAVEDFTDTMARHRLVKAGSGRGQALKNGYQDELPDIWLTNGNPWEIARPNITYRVGFYGTVDQFQWAPAEEACPPPICL